MQHPLICSCSEDSGLASPNVATNYRRLPKVGTWTCRIHSGKLTWNMKRASLKRTVVCREPLLLFHASFVECKRWGLFLFPRLCDWRMEVLKLSSLCYMFPDTSSSRMTTSFATHCSTQWVEPRPLHGRINKTTQRLECRSLGLILMENMEHAKIGIAFAARVRHLTPNTGRRASPCRPS